MAAIKLDIETRKKTLVNESNKKSDPCSIKADCGNKMIDITCFAWKTLLRICVNLYCHMYLESF